SVTKTSVYENGLVLSPRLLVRDGDIVSETWSLIMDNARFGPMLGADIQTIISCLDLGAELLQASVSHYGAAAVLGTMQYIVDADAERMTEALERIPDGDYTGEGLLDADGVSADDEYPIRVTLRKRGGHLEVDLSGTARQA